MSLSIHFIFPLRFELGFQCADFAFVLQDRVVRQFEEAEKSWRRIRGADKIELLLKGFPFKDGEPVLDDQTVQQKLAA